MILKIHITLLLALLYNLYIGKKTIFFIGYMFIIMHELSHMIMALLLNVDVEEITLLPFGASAKYKGNIPLWKEFLIAIAGPLASFIFAIAYQNNTYWMVNIVIVIFNLYPIYPLDGGRILRVFLIKIFKPKTGVRLSTYVSQVCTMILTCFAIYMLFKYNNYALLLLSLYILKISKDQAQKEKLQELINYLQIDK